MKLNKAEIWNKAAEKHGTNPVNSEVISLEEARNLGIISDGKLKIFVIQFCPHWGMVQWQHTSLWSCGSWFESRCPSLTHPHLRTIF